MILVDLNQVMISNLMAQLHSRQSKEVDEDLLSHEARFLRSKYILKIIG